MTTTLLNEFIDTRTTLLQLLNAFTQKQLNTVPFEGSWTAAQVGAHLLKGSPATVLYGKAAPTTRQPDEKLDALRGIFLNFSLKFKSQASITPENIIYEKAALLGALDGTIAQVQAVIDTQDLSATCLEYDFPTIGPLTRLEWICFFMYHMQRHIHQLKNIYEKIVMTSKV
jgi:hypothetical protein